MDTRPKVGVGVIVHHQGNILFGKRRNAHGDGTWSFPGGHLEFGETIEECAKREVLEETGISIKNIHLGPYTNDIFPVEHKHYITLFVICEYDGGILEVREPKKCEKWEWRNKNNLPSPLFIPIENLITEGYQLFC